MKRRRYWPDVFTQVRVTSDDLKTWTTKYKPPMRKAIYDVVLGNYEFEEAAEHHGVNRNYLSEEVMGIFGTVQLEQRALFDLGFEGPYLDLKRAYRPARRIDLHEFRAALKKLAPQYKTTMPIGKAAYHVMSQHVSTDYAAFKYGTLEVDLRFLVQRLEAHIIEQDLMKEFE